MANRTEELRIPDIGGAVDVDVIDVLVKPGDTVKVEDSLVTLEGDKATMDIPATAAGTVKELKIKVGDKVSQGSVILILEADGAAGAVAAPVKEAEQAPAKQPAKETPPAAKPAEAAPVVSSDKTHAGPAVRRMAREFDIDLARVPATGDKGRVTKEDMQNYVKDRMRGGESGSAGVSGVNILAMPKVDFSKFGAIETKPLSKIQKISGANLHRNWVSIPHITQFGDADITDLEEFRAQQKNAAEKKGVRLTPLVFLMKAVVAALKAYPNFNASLDPSGSELILKKYFHIGVAVDTPNGLVVPVIRDVDKKGLYELAKELADISQKAREKGLSMADMQGGCFSISSLGGIGGTAFTPIINAPEVAILGVSRTETKPVFIDGQWQPRLKLPLSLSYDHRVIDGADGARFLTFLADRLTDLRTLLL